MSAEFYETGCERESDFFHWIKIVNVSVRFVLSNYDQRQLSRNPGHVMMTEAKMLVVALSLFKPKKCKY